ncbi:hypothetical protein MED222_06420 [Vibrio sp. MED222]|nr:hypothetical protein MED222_06420 [Vibrio sp. MED222]
MYVKRLSRQKKLKATFASKMTLSL